MGSSGGGGGGGMGALTSGLGLRIPPQTMIGTPDQPLSSWLQNFLADAERQRMAQRQLEAIHAMAGGMMLTPNQWEALKSGAPTGEFLYGPGQLSRSGPTLPPPPVPGPVSIASPSNDITAGLPPASGGLVKGAIRR